MNETDIKWQKIDEDAEQLSLEEFIEECQPGRMFTDDDGSGYYALKDKKSNILCVPSEVASGKIDHRFTHVVWYNK